MKTDEARKVLPRIARHPPSSTQYGEYIIFAKKNIRRTNFSLLFSFGSSVDFELRYSGGD
jgi:hypothetical protein